MIDDPPRLEISTGFRRPDPQTVAGFAGAPTGNVADALGGSGALTHTIKPIAGEQCEFCGVAIPCEAAPGDNLAAFAALELAGPGDVILVASGGFLDAAVAGDLMLGMAQNKGVCAFVTDGAVRDVRGIQALGLPCFAAAVSPNSPARHGPGKAGMPVIIGGVSVSAGDIVVGDADGVVVVPAGKTAATLDALAAVRQAEAALDAEVAAGLTSLDAAHTLLHGPDVVRHD